MNQETQRDERADDALAQIANRSKLQDSSDIGRSDQFVERFEKDLLYCPQLDWLLWDGKRFQKHRHAAVECAKLLATERLQAAWEDFKNIEALKAAKAFRSQKSLNALVELAKSDPRLAVPIDLLDADPTIINVANGELDLRTGELRAASRASRNTKLIDIHYDATARCDFWEHHLNLITDGDRELIDFYQDAVGCSLTGDVSARKLFVACGEGTNGKTIFLETMQRLAGDYGCKISIETLLQRPSGTIPNDIARLRGVRFAYASESPKEGQFDEKRVKELTGGDRLIARFLYGEFFEFSPTHKLWVATNDKPKVSSEDTAIWDRLVLLPFEVRIPPKQRIPSAEVFQRIDAELPGILRWAVEGAHRWFERGLIIPKRVEDASTEYRAEMDDIGCFLDQCCIQTSEVKTGATRIYMAYAEYCKKMGQKPMSQPLFGAAMKRRFRRTRAGTGGSFVYHGVSPTVLWTIN